MENDTANSALAINTFKNGLTNTLGLTGFRQLVAGHMGTLLLICEQGDQTKIVKAGLEGQAMAEVERNIRGYGEIRKIGAASILPTGLEIENIEGTSVLVMDFLGPSYAERAKAGEVGIHHDFLAAMPQIYEHSLQHDPESHRESVMNWQLFLKYWYEQLAQKGKVTAQDLERIERIPIDSMTSSASTLCLSDFTPDNVFVVNNKINFIDPWEQTTFLGSPIMGLEQFRTLSEVIYALPGFNEVNSDFEVMMNKLGKSLGLTQGQIEMQRALGGSLQYALSGFVRIEGDIVKSQSFVERSLDLLNSLTIN